MGPERKSLSHMRKIIASPVEKSGLIAPGVCPALGLRGHSNAGPLEARAGVEPTSTELQWLKKSCKP